MRKALVIGAGISGLLIARVLSDFYDMVSLLERDNTQQRQGVPQGQHIHTLLARGWQSFNRFYPEFSERLEQHNIPIYNWNSDIHLYTTNGLAQKYETGVQGIGISRPTLENLVRDLTLKIANIDINYLAVEGLIVENGCVIGVKTDTGDLNADLIVDASGRNSKMSKWLANNGYDAPTESLIDPHLRYSTRIYRIPDNVNFETPSAIIQPDYKNGFYRAAAAMRIEDDKFIVTLSGTNKDYPPTDENGFLEFAQSLPDSIIADWIESLDPISSISGFQAYNRWHHYESMQLPENLIITGDSFCHFNPFYGQGMTVAALEAELLQSMLNGAFPVNQFHKKQAKIVNVSWSASTIEDMRNPTVSGAKKNIFHLLSHRFTDRLIEISVNNEYTARAFFRVMHLLSPPESLFHPRILWYMLRG